MLFEWGIAAKSFHKSLSDLMVFLHFDKKRYHDDDITSLLYSCVDPLIVYLDRVFLYFMWSFSHRKIMLIWSMYKTRIAIDFFGFAKFRMRIMCNRQTNGNVHHGFNGIKTSKNENRRLQMSLQLTKQKSSPKIIWNGISFALLVWMV